MALAALTGALYRRLPARGPAGADVHLRQGGSR
jgi:hypothetical protein